MNNVQLKLSSFKTTFSTFVHPAVDAKEVLSKNFGQELHDFEIEGVQYLIAEHNGVLDAEEIEDKYTIFVKDGNSWAQGEVSLFHWEWIFIVFGSEIVRDGNWLAYTSPIAGITFVSEEHQDRNIAFWTKKAEEDAETFGGMVEFTKSQYKPARVNSDGIWTY